MGNRLLMPKSNCIFVPQAGDSRTLLCKLRDTLWAGSLLAPNAWWRRGICANLSCYPTRQARAQEASWLAQAIATPQWPLESVLLDFIANLPKERVRPPQFSLSWIDPSTMQCLWQLLITYQQTRQPNLSQAYCQVLGSVQKLG